MGLFRFGFCAGILHFHDQPSGIIAVAAKDEEKGKGMAEERGTEEGNTKRGRNSEDSKFGIRVWNFSVPPDEVLMLTQYLPGSLSGCVLGFERFDIAQAGPNLYVQKKTNTI